MTTGPDNRKVPGWLGYRRVSPVNTSFTVTYPDVDLSGRTWVGTALRRLTSTSALALTVTVAASYSAGTGDTTLTVTFTGSQLATLIGDNAEYPFVMDLITSTGSPVYGLQGEVLVENIPGRA